MTLHLNTTTRRTAVAVATSGFLALSAQPAMAVPEPGPAVARQHRAAGCSLERVEVQLVRCDNNTGAGVEAPSWIPQH